MQRSTTIILSGVLTLLVTFLAGCARPAVLPVRASWSEQRAAAERALKITGNDFVLISGLAEPVRGKQGASDEPVELNVTLMFVSRKSFQVNAVGAPLYATRIVHFNDHRLASTLRVDDEIQRAESPDPASLEQARMIQLSPQDVLQLTLKEGEAYMGRPVDRGNITIRLPRASEKPSGLNAPAAWNITFYRTSDKYLSLWVDGQTGTVLMRSENDSKQ